MSEGLFSRQCRSRRVAIKSKKASARARFSLGLASRPGRGTATGVPEGNKIRRPGPLPSRSREALPCARGSCPEPWRFDRRLRAVAGSLCPVPEPGSCPIPHGCGRRVWTRVSRSSATLSTRHSPPRARTALPEDSSEVTVSSIWSPELCSQMENDFIPWRNAPAAEHPG